MLALVRKMLFDFAAAKSHVSFCFSSLLDADFMFSVQHVLGDRL